MKWRSGILILVVWVFAMSFAASAQRESSRAQRQAWNEYLPPGAGKELVATQCTACHDLKGTVQLRQSKDEWESLVIDMVGRGANLTVEQADQVIPYLAEVFGPQAPPLVDVNAAPAEDLVKLPGVTKDAADKLVAHRTTGAKIATREEAQTLLGLDAAAFEKVKWYVRADGK
jgi:hypothetical protein